MIAMSVRLHAAALAIACLFAAGASLADDDKGKDKGDKHAEKAEKKADKQQRKADKHRDRDDVKVGQ